MSWVNVGVAAASLVSGVVGSNKAEKGSKRARQLEGQLAGVEADREQRIEQTTGMIDRIFDSPKRKGQHGDFASALREKLMGELAKRKGDVSRDRKFSVARSGLTGGSVDRDTRSRLGDEFADATVGVERQTQGALSDLKSQDELMRQNLIQQARGGMDATTALRRGTNALQSNVADAANSSRGQLLGDVFKNTAATHRRIQERQERRRGFGYSSNRQDLYGSK